MLNENSPCFDRLLPTYPLPSISRYFNRNNKKIKKPENLFPPQINNLKVKGNQIIRKSRKEEAKMQNAVEYYCVRGGRLKPKSKYAKSSVVIFVEKTTIVAERLVFWLKFSEENEGS
jgi:hypothetical protein